MYLSRALVVTIGAPPCTQFWVSKMHTNVHLFTHLRTMHIYQFCLFGEFIPSVHILTHKMADRRSACMCALRVVDRVYSVTAKP